MNMKDLILWDVMQISLVGSSNRPARLSHSLGIHET